MSCLVDSYEEATELRIVDSKQLLGSEGDIPVDAAGCPTALRALTVCKDPRITVFPNFFTDVECDHVLQMVEGGWMPSQVSAGSEEAYKKADLENKLSQTRTSWSCMMRYAQTSVIERLELRLAAVTGLPVENLERMNMVRYSPGELFSMHHDGHFRPKTVFVYLNDLPEDDDAGDTYFPVLGYSFRPRRGTAVMWSNQNESGEEDGRMIHAGKAPKLGVKYGVNCFFNQKHMRNITYIGDNAHELDDVVPVEVQQLWPAEEPREKDGNPQLFNLVVCQDPRVFTVPFFLLEHEVQHFLDLMGDGKPYVAGGTDGPFAQGVQTLRILDEAETVIVQGIEERLSGCAGLAVGHLGHLRIVHPGTELGLCNRGNGPTSAYICLSETDEVFFPRLGLRLQLRAGDLVAFPNMFWQDDTTVVEDVRSVRMHVPRASGARAIGIDAYFFDSLIRQEQKKRHFAPDLGVLGGK
mmetsp:Transcript_43596/g.102778  ORF Transcript_43596/g.102778 Transcript_43596/m.102778 type:complete len:467 (+) Transcript_43596:101-1501(+)